MMVLVLAIRHWRPGMEIFGTHRPKQLKTFDGTTYYYTADALSRIEEKAELNTLYSS